MKKWCALTSVLLFVIGQVWSQTTISGKVVSVESGNPVDGANIRVDHSLAVVRPMLKESLSFGICPKEPMSCG